MQSDICRCLKALITLCLVRRSLGFASEKRKAVIFNSENISEQDAGQSLKAQIKTRTKKLTLKSNSNPEALEAFVNYNDSTGPPS